MPRRTYLRQKFEKKVEIEMLKMDKEYKNAKKSLRS